MSNVRVLLSEARRLNDDLLDASAEAEAVLAVQPANVAALTARGAVRAQEGRLSDAESDLRRALGLAPDNPETHRNPTTCCGTVPATPTSCVSSATPCPEPDATKKRRRHTREESSCRPETPTARADLFTDMGLWDRAVDTAARAIELGQPDLSTYLELGWALQHGDAADPDRSIEIYKRPVALAPQDPWPRKGLANAYHLTGEQKLTTEHYTWAVNALAGISPRDAFLNSLRGWCPYRLTRYIEALDCFQRAADDPRLRAGVLLDLMLARLGLHEDNEARLTYQAAVTALENLHMGHRLGVATVGLDNLRTALTHDLAERRDSGLNLLDSLTALLASHETASSDSSRTTSG